MTSANSMPVPSAPEGQDTSSPIVWSAIKTFPTRWREESDHLPTWQHWLPPRETVCT